MVSTDLLLTWSKNNIHDGYILFSLLEIQWVYSTVITAKVKREIQKPSYDFYRNWNAIIILPCIYIWYVQTIIYIEGKSL